MMNVSQTKLVGLTMELDFKAREYKKICDELDRLKEKIIDPNDKRLLEVKEMFQQNHDDIVKINAQIKEIKEIEENIKSNKVEKYDLEKVYNKKKDKMKENTEIAIIEDKKNIFYLILKKIKNLLIKHK